MSVVEVELVGGPSDGHFGVALAHNLYEGFAIPVLNLETGEPEQFGVYRTRRKEDRWVGIWDPDGHPASPRPLMTCAPSEHRFGTWKTAGPTLKVRTCERCGKVERWV